MTTSASSSIVLSELLSPATVILRLTSQDGRSVLAELAERVPGLGGDPQAKGALLRALQEREQLHSTGIGDGVALPHARNAVVGCVSQPTLVFGRHPTGIGYGAIDGVPVRLFFLLLAPSVTQHLAMLARISRIVRDPRVRQELTVAETPEQVLACLRAAEARFLTS